jgi:hypothetical protein
VSDIVLGRVSWPGTASCLLASERSFPGCRGAQPPAALILCQYSKADYEKMGVRQAMICARSKK